MTSCWFDCPKNEDKKKFIEQFLRNLANYVKVGKIGHK